MTEGVRRSLLWAIGLAGLGLGGGLLLKSFLHSEDLFRYLMAGLTIWLIALSVAVRRTRLFNLVLMVTIVVAMIGVLDKAAAWLMPRNGPELVTVIKPAGYRVYRPDAELGYALVPNDAEDATLTAAGRIIYHAHYGVGADGARITVSGAADGQTAGSVVFLGDSLTFGEGVDDAATLPSQFARDTGGRYQVTNLAVSGYGTQQVLRALETGRLDPVLHGANRTIIYPAIPDHLRRIAGLAGWDLWGPRYRLENGMARYVGPFHSQLMGNVLRLAQRSTLFTLADGVWSAHLVAAAYADTTLWGAMVAQARDLAISKYRARFLVLLWNTADPSVPADTSARMAAELDRRGVPYLRISDLVPDVNERSADYAFAFDRHPTPLMNERLAASLAAKFQSTSGEDAASR